MIILTMSKISVVIRFYRFDKLLNVKKDSVCFASRNKSTVLVILSLANVFG